MWRAVAEFERQRLAEKIQLTFMSFRIARREACCLASRHHWLRISALIFSCPAQLCMCVSRAVSLLSRPDTVWKAIREQQVSARPVVSQEGAELHPARTSQC